MPFICIEDFVVNNGQKGASNGIGNFNHVPELKGYFIPDDPIDPPREIATCLYRDQKGKYLELEFLDGWHPDTRELIKDLKFRESRNQHWPGNGDTTLVADLIKPRKIGTSDYYVICWTKNVIEDYTFSSSRRETLIEDHLTVAKKHSEKPKKAGDDDKDREYSSLTVSEQRQRNAFLIDTSTIQFLSWRWRVY